MASTTTHGIEITADDVTLDLGGFSVVGPITCTGEGSTLSCGAGSGRGIWSTGTQRINVRNGSVRGFGSDGIYLLSQDARLSGLRVEENGGIGIAANGGIIRDCIASRNDSTGIVPGVSITAAVVVRNTAVGNSSRGINVNEGSVVFGNSAARNGGEGIKAFRGSSVHRNSSVDNEG